MMILDVGHKNFLPPAPLSKVYLLKSKVISRLRLDFEFD